MRDWCDRWVGLRVYVFLSVIIGLVVICYGPALVGPFLFDDFANLDALGALGGIKDWVSFKAYVFGGSAGPLGRPVALFTFLVDGRDWPADPWPFKRTNLVIHIITFIVIYLLMRKLITLTERNKQMTLWLPILCAGVWVLHPYLMSTVMYVVQRMAQLAALFVLLGLYCHVSIRASSRFSTLKRHMLLSLNMALFGVLALFSKENGVLLPMFILLVELTLLRDVGLAKVDWRWQCVFLWVPSLLIIAYLLQPLILSDWKDVHPVRGFSIYERLLSESRVLIDYLRHWVLPSMATSGVFHDDFTISTGLFSPYTTFLSLIFHAVVIGGVLLFRRVNPWLCFSVLFFYVSHLVESTTVLLELYFEHRNYLASVFLFVPLVLFLARRFPLKYVVSSLFSVICVLSFFTYSSANIWSSNDMLVTYFAKIQPGSARAQQTYSMLLYNRGQKSEALAVADSAMSHIPASSSLLIWRALLQCKVRGESDLFDSMQRRLAVRPYDVRMRSLYKELIAESNARSCRGLGLDRLLALFDAILAQPKNAEISSMRYADLQYLRGLTLLDLSDFLGARNAFIASLNSRGGASKSMLLASLFASAGEYNIALEFSALARSYLSRAEWVGGITLLDILDFDKQVKESMK